MDNSFHQQHALPLPPSFYLNDFATFSTPPHHLQSITSTTGHHDQQFVHYLWQLWPPHLFTDSIVSPLVIIIEGTTPPCIQPLPPLIQWPPPLATFYPSHDHIKVTNLSIATTSATTIITSLSPTSLATGHDDHHLSPHHHMQKLPLHPTNLLKH